MTRSALLLASRKGRDVPEEFLTVVNQTIAIAIESQESDIASLACTPCPTCRPQADNNRRKRIQSRPTRNLQCCSLLGRLAVRTRESDGVTLIEFLVRSIRTLPRSNTHTGEGKVAWDGTEVVLHEMFVAFVAVVCLIQDLPDRTLPRSRRRAEPQEAQTTTRAAFGS